MRLNTYARLPQTVDVNGIPYCVWEGIEPRHAGEAKGLGLFATRQLPKGYCIPYGGVWRPESERVSVAKHPDRYYPRENAYFLKYRRPLPAERGGRKKIELGVLDTHPIRVTSWAYRSSAGQEGWSTAEIPGSRGTAPWNTSQ